MNLMNDQLRAFHAVQQLGSVHAAAAKLRLTQAAVTLRIKALEGSLKSTLFIRSRRGMQLTEQGSALLRYCQRAIELEAEMIGDITGVGSDTQSVHITLQGPSSLIRTRILPAYPALLSKYPYLTMTTRINDLESGLVQLKSGQTDLLITEKSKIGLEFDSKILKPERYILVAPENWKKRSTEDIIRNERIIDFDETDQMTFSLLDKYKLRNLAKKDRHFINTTDGIADLICSALGYSVLSLEMATPYLKTGAMVQFGKDYFFDFQTAIAWYPRKFSAQWFRDFLNVIK